MNWIYFYLCPVNGLHEFHFIVPFTPQCVFPCVNTFPERTRRRFNVYTTSFQHYGRCIDVKTTLYAYKGFFLINKYKIKHINPLFIIYIFFSSYKVYMKIINCISLLYVHLFFPGEKQGENTCTRRSVRKYLGNPERNCTSLRPYPVTWCEGVCFPQKDVSKRGPLANFQKYLEKNQKR